MEFKLGKESSISTLPLSGIANPSNQITVNLFNVELVKRKTEERVLARMVIDGAKRLGFIDQRIKEPPMDNPKNCS